MSKPCILMVSGRRCYAAGCIEPIGSLVRLSIISSLDYSDYSSHPRLSRDSAHCVLASFKEDDETLIVVHDIISGRLFREASRTFGPATNKALVIACWLTVGQAHVLSAHVCIFGFSAGDGVV